MHTHVETDDIPLTTAAHTFHFLLLCYTTAWYSARDNHTLNTNGWPLIRSHNVCKFHALNLHTFVSKYMLAQADNDTTSIFISQISSDFNMRDYAAD